MRNPWLDIPLADFAKHFSPIAEKFEMQWRLARSDYRPRMIILVSKYDHCLVDLLYRQRSGEACKELDGITRVHVSKLHILPEFRPECREAL